MREEIEELERQGIWELVDLPHNRQALGGRWVYKKKINNTNDTIKYKSRWVVQGFNQVEFLDYMETFSTVCRPETYRIAFVLTISNGWLILQYDVKNAFVHADIDEEIYVQLPTGFYNNNNKVCRLRKALYGLKQSLRLWYKYLSKILNKLGYAVFNCDEGAFINPTTQSIIMCYVDDLLITGPNADKIMA